MRSRLARAFGVEGRRFIYAAKIDIEGSKRISELVIQRFEEGIGKREPAQRSLSDVGISQCVILEFPVRGSVRRLARAFGMEGRRFICAAKMDIEGSKRISELVN